MLLLNDKFIFFWERMADIKSEHKVREKIPILLDELNNLKEVEETFAVTGNTDLLLKVRVENTDKLNEFIMHTLGKIEGLGETSYFIARNRGSFTEGVVCRTITPVCAELTRLDFGGDGQIVTGTVVLDDIPSANLKLALRGNTFGQFLCYTTTDADGNFVFTGVIEGEYNIRPVGDFDTVLTSVDVVDTDP